MDNCGNMAVPIAHMAADKLCSRPGQCQELPHGAGIADADFVLYVSALMGGSSLFACNAKPTEVPPPS
jgi:hypothetical protein